MLLRAFSSGAVALSGVEAVSNGVPAFEKPESKNAATTLMWMGGILGSCFFGVSVLVDPFSANYLRGAVIDFSDALTGGGFKISNPNAKQNCGCGKSFQA